MATLKDLASRQLKIERKFKEIQEISKKNKLTHDQLLTAMQEWEEFIKGQAKIVHSLAVLGNLIIDKLDITHEDIEKAHKDFNERKEKVKNDYGNQDQKDTK